MDNEVSSCVTLVYYFVGVQDCSPITAIKGVKGSCNLATFVIKANVMKLVQRLAQSTVHLLTLREKHTFFKNVPEIFHVLS